MNNYTTHWLSVELKPSSVEGSASFSLPVFAAETVFMFQEWPEKHKETATCKHLLKKQRTAESSGRKEEVLNFFIP